MAANRAGIDLLAALLCLQQNGGIFTFNELIIIKIFVAIPQNYDVLLAALLQSAAIGG
ncbi:MAG: hypothetical protein HRT77_04795 [Halioglobus sp.]|nr:hypothetical protein [Halioglobus sp.]